MKKVDIIKLKKFIQNLNSKLRCELIKINLTIYIIPIFV